MLEFMPPKPITRNTLFYGDKLAILREHITSESVDLVCLDPPFNSNRTYSRIKISVPKLA